MGSNMDFDVAVIGAGVVGLAVARQLAINGRDVIVLEAQPTFGSCTSSRNSEVIHAGIYYTPGSLKARLCVAGRDLLYAFCADHQVRTHRCGKLIVATSEAEVATLEGISTRALASGVGDLLWLSPQEARRLEPEVRCSGALLSPSTGIVDSHGFMLALIAGLEGAGGLIAYRAPVDRWERIEGGFRIETGGDQPGVLTAQSAVNAAGHGALPLLGRLQGFPSGDLPEQLFAKGSYFHLSGPPPFRRLVYPVPVPGGLGVHATIDLGGQVRFGPDVEWVNGPDDLAVDPARAEAFYAVIRRYWPGLRDGALAPDYAGVRPKLSSGGVQATDFLIEGEAQHGISGLVNLLGIESPGLTSSLAIAREVAAQIA
jgi:L-2-hydroxyglutarate oxidase LhgO